jgi:hypothetical protein
MATSALAVPSRIKGVERVISARRLFRILDLAI